MDFFFFFSICYLLLNSPSSAAVDLTNLIFKGCSSQKFQDQSGTSAQNLKTLFQSLVDLSSQKTFSTAVSGDISGLFQCRGDLSVSQCHDCVSEIPRKVSRLCGGGGGGSVAARVHLTGCYLKYEVSGFKQTADEELLFKVCGSAATAAAGLGFEQRRDAALDAMQSGLKSSNNGVFVTGSYQSVFYLAQCEADLAAGNCRSCVKSAVDAAKSQCVGGSISSQAYLNKCYVSYAYYPNGVPAIGNSNSGGGGGGGGGKQHTAKTVALAVGGVAAVGLLVAFLLVVKSAVKKGREGGGGKHGGGGGGWN
ncbi:Plasmodesmata-located protein 1 [Linum perenne]